MPIRSYRCAAGHEFEALESMDGPSQTQCPDCNRPVERVMSLTQPGIVKGGTPTYHTGRQPRDPQVKPSTVRGIRGM